MKTNKSYFRSRKIEPAPPSPSSSRILQAPYIGFSKKERVEYIVNNDSTFNEVSILFDMNGIAVKLVEPAPAVKCLIIMPSLNRVYLVYSLQK